MLREPITIKALTYNTALRIATWTYESPYDIYNVRAGDEAIEEVLSDEYYSVSGADGKLVGYFCLGAAARVPAGYDSGAYDDENLMDIGLGMRPDLTGQGFGALFLDRCLAMARELYRPAGFRLSVASFNRRAITVYERSGFTHVMTFAHTSFNRTFEFWLMIKDESA